MANIGHVPIKDGDSNEQSFDFVFLLEVQIEDLLNGIGSVELGNDVSLLLLLKQCIGDLLGEAHVVFINLVQIIFVLIVLFGI